MRVKIFLCQNGIRAAAGLTPCLVYKICDVMDYKRSIKTFFFFDQPLGQKLTSQCNLDHQICPSSKLLASPKETSVSKGSLILLILINVKELCRCFVKSNQYFLQQHAHIVQMFTIKYLIKITNLEDNPKSDFSMFIIFGTCQILLTYY